MTPYEKEEESACLRCGTGMQYDWMTCPQCGWRADGPWEDESEIPEVAERSTGRLTGAWVKWAAWILVLILGVLALLGLF